MDVQFQGYDCKLVFGHYGNGNTAIQLIDKEDDSLVATSTVCGEMEVEEEIVGVKDWSENEGMVTALINSNVIKPEPVNFEPSGFVLIGYFELTNKALQELEIFKNKK